MCLCYDIGILILKHVYKTYICMSRISYLPYSVSNIWEKDMYNMYDKKFLTSTKIIIIIDRITLIFSNICTFEELKFIHLKL